MRREFTAVGETVNLAQRIEQLTKTCGGPVLVSDETRRRLRRAVPVEPAGLQAVAGVPEPVAVHRVTAADWGCRGGGGFR
jgi:adenylate cyclase